MSKNAIFIRTAKAENASAADLSIDLKRVLSYMDGKSRSDDLAKRAPPSLRKQWNELLAELVEGGYIVFNSKAKIEEKPDPREHHLKAGFVNKSAIVANANEPNYQRLTAAEQVVAELEAAAAALENAAKHKDSSSSVHGSSAAARVVAELESAAAAARPSNIETVAAAKAKQEAEAIAKAKAESEDKKKAEKAARAAELRAFFASARKKADAETKQIEKEAARVRAEQEAAAAKAKLDAEAELKRRERGAHAHAEKESAAAAAKTKSESNAEAKRREQEAARVQLESAVASAKERSAAQANARAAAKQREQETAQACAELEAAILATKAASDLKVSAWQEVEDETPIAKSGRKYIGDPRPYVWRAKLGEPQAGDAQRLRDLEIENECLKKLLTDAYVEIEILKAPKP